MLDKMRYKFKVCVLGDAAVGKTTTVTKFSKGVFTNNYLVTMGVQHSTHKIIIQAGERAALADLVLWDIGGQDQFETMRPMFYRLTNGVIIMFDLSSRESFDNLEKWVNDAVIHMGLDVPMVIVGNKADITPHEVDLVDADRFAKDRGAEFVVTSAKNGLNIGYLFQAIGRAIYEKLHAEEIDTVSLARKSGIYS